MKQLVQVMEVEGEGLEGLMGQNVTFWCMNYIYTGKLVGVNDNFVKLENAKVVYETGPLTTSTWQDAQSLPHACYVMLSSVEAFMVLK